MRLKLEPSFRSQSASEFDTIFVCSPAFEFVSRGGMYLVKEGPCIGTVSMLGHEYMTRGAGDCKMNILKLDIYAIGMTIFQLVYGYNWTTSELHTFQTTLSVSLAHHAQSKLTYLLAGRKLFCPVDSTNETIQLISDAFNEDLIPDHFGNNPRLMKIDLGNDFKVRIVSSVSSLTYVCLVWIESHILLVVQELLLGLLYYQPSERFSIEEVRHALIQGVTCADE